ncbi:YlaF family protein [Bacillus dakarensis]|uniref:YlaF family protein n=1 Tax=Robertmurraya dakarensis TaxID=1926278 RepID=UPI0009814F45|nr:YlaF family protein [Bacillus dakarensis]
MNNIKWPLLFFAIAAAACMIWTGIAIGFRSSLGVIASLVALVLVMGFGFKTKKKMRENGEL